METTLLQTIADPGIVNWLLTQSPIVIILAVIIWWLAKRLERAENDKSDLAKDVIKLTVAYETKLDNDKAADQEIKNLLHEIRDTVRNWGK